jgi:hypothetical protein
MIPLHLAAFAEVIRERHGRLWFYASSMVDVDKHPTRLLQELEKLGVTEGVRALSHDKTVSWRLKR